MLPKVTETCTHDEYKPIMFISLAQLTNLGLSGLSLSAGCRLNSPAEKEVITGWILASDHSVKNNERFLDYARTIM